MQTLAERIAVVTGASSGIGKAIALGLAEQGAKLGLVGRKLETLEAVAAMARKSASIVLIYCADLTVDEEIDKLKADIERDFGQVDLLIHSAGAFTMGSLHSTPVEKLDWLYRVNVRAPYVLTHDLLPMILSRQGQIVFINSSVGLKAKATVGQYAATKHALRAVADSLREEVNADQVRVLSVFPGRTATPLQAIIHETEGKPYYPERLMQPEDVAAAVISALSLPRSAEVTDISLRPFAKPI